MDKQTDTDSALRFEIDGMHCSSCVAHVEEALTAVEGVSNA